MLIRIIFFVLIILAGITLYKNFELQKIEQENALLRAYMDTMEQFYSVIMEHAETVRKYRHDLAKHIQTLQVLAEKTDDRLELQPYMQDLTAQYDQLKTYEYCRNEVLSSVLTLKKQQCSREQIPFEINIEDHSYSEITDFDLVSLLHNLLDNAIEANEQIAASSTRPATQGIRLAMGRTPAFIWLTLENHVIPNSEVTFETMKKDKENHGLGTKIILSLVNKYQGHYEKYLNRERSVFVQQFEFPVTTDNKEI